MTARAVHWHEGMFLRPHHLQAATRHAADSLHTSSQWDVHHNWGLRAFQMDAEALANHRFVVRSLRARLRDGTLIRVPEDGELPALDLKPPFERGELVRVFLGVPVVRLGRSNVAAARPEEGGRYLLDTQELEDENTGLNPQPLEVRLLNLQLLLGDRDHAGFEVLELARFQKTARADATPELHLPYIPSVLGCDAWAPLQHGILQAVYDRIGRNGRLLAEQVLSRGITLGSRAPDDAQILANLDTLNEAYALLHILAFAPGVHPFDAYLELCRLVGQLSLLGKTRLPPDLPRYDHDDLGGCFLAVKQHIEALIDSIPKPEYVRRQFEGVGQRMQVALEPAWLEPQWQMFVGVKSQLSPEECVALLTGKGSPLDMKIGSSEQVDRIFKVAAAGLRFTHTPTPPRALPAEPGLIYFQVSRDSDEWLNVQRLLTLAVRINETRVADGIHGKRVLAIRGVNTTLEFILFVVKQ
jgi:type VI secretion system protein ImpJ